MAGASSRPPDPTHLLTSIATGDKPLAIVLAGHNGSGKSTLWYDKLADQLRIPLVNADRLTLSILPPRSTKSRHCDLGPRAYETTTNAGKSSLKMEFSSSWD